MAYRGGVVILGQKVTSIEFLYVAFCTCCVVQWLFVFIV